MVTEIKIYSDSGELLEKIKIKKPPLKFIIYRGRLLVATHRFGGGNIYTEQLYLELY